MKTKNKCLAILSLIVTLQGCATPYKPFSFGEGYTDMALSKDTYVVSFKGNGITNEMTVNKYLLRRCAELTVNNGYKYFAIIDGNSSVDVNFVQLPGSVNTQTHSGFGYSNSHTTINPGQQLRFDQHTSHALIKLLPTNENIPQAMDAKFILSTTQD